MDLTTGRLQAAEEQLHQTDAGERGMQELSEMAKFIREVGASTIQEKQKGKATETKKMRLGLETAGVFGM